MPEESEVILRKSLDAVDRFRTRTLAGVLVLFLFTVLALWSLNHVAATAGGAQGQTKILFVSVAAQMVYVGLCTLIVALQITRMTKTILKAIELTSQK
jgi:hypothetical protein